MKRALVATTAALAAFAMTSATAHAAHGRGDLTVGLNGANEVGTEGDPNGSGKIHLDFFAAVDNPSVVFPGQDYVCFELTVRNVEEAIGLHIHEVNGATKNPRKDTGPVVVNLGDEELQREDADGNPCVAMADGDLEGILEDPSEYYVNYHTESHRGGAIRGQLHAFS